MSLFLVNLFRGMMFGLSIYFLFPALLKYSKLDCLDYGYKIFRQ